MSSSDPAIKLFGKTIIALPLPTQDDSGGGGGHDDKGFPSEETGNSTHEIITMKEKGEDTCPASDGQGVDAPITTPVDHEAPKRSHSSSDDDDGDDDQAGKDLKSSQGNNNDSDPPGNAHEKPPLKKPDKILPCPRCNSMDTKFCYYNNYNVNQPRHFCKKCQRYWTAGGTMRNVPVGAGRRKNKNAAAAAHYRHLTITDAAALQAITTSDSIHHHALNPNGTVLSFGSDAPLCESMASVLNLAEKTIKNCNGNGFHRTDEQMEEQSTGPSTAALYSSDDGNGANLHQAPAIRNYQGFVPRVPYINGASSPWPYPWGPPQPASPTVPHPTAASPFCGSSFPIPIYPAAAAAAAAAAASAYWGCTTWSMPWIAPMASTSPTSGSGSNSPTLGKHPREGEVLHRGGESFKQSNQEEKNLWVPKTLRIDDPEDAAKSSIWATMGFDKDDKPGGMSSRKGGGLFKTFQNSKTEPGHQGRMESNSQVLRANPAALSRSINFNETS